MTTRLISRALPLSVLGLALIGTTPPVTATGVEAIVSSGLRELSVTPVQSAVGTVIGQICPSGNIITDPDLQARCNEIAVAGVFDPSSSNITSAQDGLQAMGNEEDAVIASSEVDSRGAHMDAVNQRLGNLRLGGTGLAYQNANGFNLTGGAAGDAGSSPWGYFVNGLYATTDRDTTAREAGFEGDDYGVTAGVDYSFDDKVVVGAAFGYKNSDNDVDSNGGQLESDSYSYLLYWSLYPDENWYVDGMAGYTDSDYDQERNIIYSIPALAGGGVTTVNNTALSDTDSEEWSISLTAGRNFHAANWVMTPHARLEYADVGIDGFTERMALTTAAGSGLALDVDGQDFESLTTSAGATLMTELQTGIGAVFPQLTLEYTHEFKNNNEPITARFVGDSSNTTIVLLTDQADRNFFTVGAGFTAAFSDAASGFVRWQGLFGYEDLDVHTFEVGLRTTF
jgi:outer membrane autotransporter protein